MKSQADVVRHLLDSELQAIRSAVEGNNIEQCVASLTQRAIAATLVKQEYEGRYPLELLQNASDAATRARRSGDDLRSARVRFVLTETALIVANMGKGFDDQDVRSICGLGQTSKDPRETIGYKGLGFKSVGEISDTPQILSGGYRFSFDGDRAKREVERLVGTRHPRLQVPAFAFPFPLDPEELGDDRHIVEACEREGYATVVRLPLKEDAKREDIARALDDALVPRILLLLDAVDVLIVDGTQDPFCAERDGDKGGPMRRVVLQINDTTLEDWLLFQHPVDIPSRNLVTELGDGWADVRRVGLSVAVRLRNDAPDASQSFPLHVYFPTEDSAGFAFIVHADFSVAMDRRHINKAREAKSYNEWLAKELVRFIAHDVINALIAEFGATAFTVAVLAADEANTPFTRGLREKYVTALRSVRFIPTVGGGCAEASRALLLPGQVGNAVAASAYLDLSRIGTLVRPEVQANTRARLLLSDLQVPSLTTKETLRVMRARGTSQADFYEWLNHWANAEDFQEFAKLLVDVPCVRTTTGTWVVPSGDVYFPRERNAPALPDDLPLQIADVPETARLLLQAAGVRPFRWREIVLSSVLPILCEPAASDERRDSAHRALSAYWASEGGNDSEITGRVGETLVPVTRASGVRTQVHLRRADQTYFSAAWLDRSNLEKIYGPFAEAEFLDQPPPSSMEERAIQQRYLEWLGVAARPRVDRQSIPNLRTHVPGWPGLLFSRWSTESAEALGCTMVHPASARSGTLFTLDRFESIVQAANADRLRCLLQELAMSWGTYADAVETVVRCQNKAHKYPTERRTSSLFRFGLRELAWIPAARGNASGLYRPRDIWLSSGDIPKKVLAMLPSLSGPFARSIEPMGRELGMVDGARASAAQLTDALRLLADAGSRDGEEVTEEVAHGARWLMRHLNDALADGVALEVDGNVRLLARTGGKLAFVTRPFFTDDPLYADLWRGEIPILEGDREMGRLHRAFQLRDLKRESSILPKPEAPDQSKSNELRAHLWRAAPYLAAVAIDATPSQAENMRSRLSRIDVAACARLVVECSITNEKRFERLVTTYLARKKDGSSSLATIHVDVSGPADFYSMGRQLAEFLETPSQGDAFALILKGDEVDRNAYLASRRILLQRVHEEREKLHNTSDGILATLDERLLRRSPSQPPPQEAPRPVPASHAEPSDGSVPEDAAIVDTASSPEPEPAPPLDVDGILGHQVVGGSAKGASRQGGAPPFHNGEVGAHRDRAQEEAEHRAVGKRGEEAAVLLARRQAREAGLSESVVVWQSRINEESPYDIESIDADGVVFYIEVKSTAGNDEGAEFELSSAELKWAAAHPKNYLIYRVVDVNSARPRIFIYDDIIGRVGREEIHTSLGSVRMRLPTSAQVAPLADST